MRQHRLRGLRGPAIERPEACDHRPEGGPGGPPGALLDVGSAPWLRASATCRMPMRLIVYYPKP